MRAKTLGLAAAMGFASMAAQAEILKNYDDWKALPAAGKAGYVAGLFDALLMSTDPNANLAPSGLYECSVRLKLTPASMAETLDAVYTGSQSWSSPPSFLFVQQVITQCRRDLNAARRAKGLGPIPE